MVTKIQTDRNFVFEHYINYKGEKFIRITVKETVCFFKDNSYEYDRNPETNIKASFDLTRREAEEFLKQLSQHIQDSDHFFSDSN